MRWVTNSTSNSWCKMLKNVIKFRKLPKVTILKWFWIISTENWVHHVSVETDMGHFSPKMTVFLDRTGLNNSSSVQNLQNTLLKALNLNIMIEHQQKNIETDPKLRFLDFLTRLQGMFNCILIGSFVFNIPCWSCLVRVVRGCLWLIIRTSPAKKWTYSKFDPYLEGHFR